MLLGTPFTLMSWESRPDDFQPHWASPDPRQPPTSLALTQGLGPVGSKGVDSVSVGVGGPGRARGGGSRTRSWSLWSQDFYQPTLSAK